MNKVSWRNLLAHNFLFINFIQIKLKTGTIIKLITAQLLN
jgi:hypothetical protein